VARADGSLVRGRAFRGLAAWFRVFFDGSFFDIVILGREVWAAAFCVLCSCFLFEAYVCAVRVPVPAAGLGLASFGGRVLGLEVG
jgi:hypothetical protein